MVSDETYHLCLPILQDQTLEEEDKIDQLEELLKKETTLQGSVLDNAVLDAVWRFREGGGSATSPPPIRQTILRRPSPASWRGSVTPVSGSPRLGVSPLAPPGFVPPSFGRSNKSAAASPFGSPRPSPRLAFATPAPVIPNSPSLNAYEFASDPTPAIEIFGDAQQADNVDWLVSDDAASVTSSVGTSSGLNAAAPEFSVSAQQHDMTPYDMLRSILGPTQTDEEIDAALASHGYDLGATIMAIMEQQQQQQQQDVAAFSLAQNSVGGGPPPTGDEGTSGVLIGKSMTPDGRPSTPLEPKSGVLCKFFLSTGQCLRADCRFSHDLSNHICKYWVAGNCLAGPSCVFSHDPARLMSRLTLDGTSTPPSQIGTPPHIQFQDYNMFPLLQPQPGTPEQLSVYPASSGYPAVALTPPPGFKLPGHNGEILRPRSRPSSRHQMHKNDLHGANNNANYNGNSSNNHNQIAPPMDDTEAFPSLGSASAKGATGKKHHGKRGGHGHHKEGTGASTAAPSSLADIVKMSPSPSPSPGPDGSPASSRQASRRLLRNGSSASMRNSAAAQAIPTPKHIPWLETGDKANKAYLKARQDAIKHGGLRNKFLQSAAQAWNRKDARAARALSLRGQSENDMMRKAHRDAARELYEERNKQNRAGNGSGEIYVDLHGLHADEAVEYLERVLLENGKEVRPVYAITGTGHHSKNGKDKVGKAIRSFLDEWRYVYREFSVPGDRNNMGGILGIDARSWDKSLLRERESKGGNSSHNSVANHGNGAKNSSSNTMEDIFAHGVEIGEGKVKLLVRDQSKDSKRNS